MYFYFDYQTTSLNFQRNTNTNTLMNRSQTTGTNLLSMEQQTACESFCSEVVLSGTQPNTSDEMLISIYEELWTIQSC